MVNQTHDIRSRECFGSRFIRVMLRFLFDARYEAKNRKLVQFTFVHATKADKKQKLKLRISDT